MRKYVVDASIIIKWLLGDEGEPDQKKAIILLNEWVKGNTEISTPTLWQYEVGNFLGREIPEEALAKMELLLDLNIRNVVPSHGICKQCFLWMKEKRITFYDASYLAAAREIGAILVTADEAFVKKMGNPDNICLLKNLDLAAP